MAQSLTKIFPNLGTTLEGFGFESQEGHAYDLDRKFSLAMANACDAVQTTSPYHVIDSEVAGCVTFGLCSAKQVGNETLHYTHALVDYQVLPFQINYIVVYRHLINTRHVEER